MLMQMESWTHPPFRPSSHSLTSTHFPLSLPLCETRSPEGHGWHLWWRGITGTAGKHRQIYPKTSIRSSKIILDPLSPRYSKYDFFFISLPPSLSLPVTRYLTCSRISFVRIKKKKKIGTNIHRKELIGLKDSLIFHGHFSFFFVCCILYCSTILCKNNHQVCYTKKCH